MYQLHDGYQTCPGCQGQGCYWCRKTGHRAQCPRCMNVEPELIHHSGEDIRCDACGTKFDRSGKIVLR